mmetsp:Transcript_2499/g.3146  ORF Transcript_2499/g.3146 Transcript_2499/m.3146 type:complete len:249 (-) Transcript_2499:1256-2002(-)
MLRLKREIVEGVSREGFRAAIRQRALDIAGKRFERVAILCTVYCVVSPIEDTLSPSAPIASISGTDWVIAEENDKFEDCAAGCALLEHLREDDLVLVGDQSALAFSVGDRAAAGRVENEGLWHGEDNTSRGHHVVRWRDRQSIVQVFDESKVVRGAELNEIHVARLEHFTRDCHSTAISLSLLKHELRVCEVRVGVELNGIRVRHVVRQHNKGKRDNTEGARAEKLSELAALYIDRVIVEVDTPVVSW